MTILDDLMSRHPALSPVMADLSASVDLLENTFREGRKLLVCGNGGAAADAEHIAGELMKEFMFPRKLTPEDAERLPADLAKNLENGLPAIPLTGFPALSTAFTNDCDGAYTFAQLVWVLGNAGDCLLALSTSGNSINIVRALHAAKARGVRSVLLTGNRNGAAVEHADIVIAIPEGSTPRIQEYHAPIYHALCAAVEERFFG